MSHCTITLSCGRLSQGFQHNLQPFLLCIPVSQCSMYSCAYDGFIASRLVLKSPGARSQQWGSSSASVAPATWDAPGLSGASHTPCLPAYTSLFFLTPAFVYVQVSGGRFLCQLGGCAAELADSPVNWPAGGVCDHPPQNRPDHHNYCSFDHGAGRFLLPPGSLISNHGMHSLTLQAASCLTIVALTIVLVSFVTYQVPIAKHSQYSLPLVAFRHAQMLGSSH